MRNVSSAFQARLQQGGQLVELIDLDCRNASFHWTTANNRLFATLSGDTVEYLPFPGGVPNGIEESNDLGVSVIDFVMANTGEVFSAIMAGGDFAAAGLRISRVFADTLVHADGRRFVVFVSEHESPVTVTPQVAGELRTLHGDTAAELRLDPWGVAVRELVQE